MLQHYVPRFILDGFCDNDFGNRGVWVYHAKYRSWKKRSTRRTASIDDLYSLTAPNGERDDAIEAVFEQFETAAALFVGKTVAQRRPIEGPPHRDDVFVTFCSLLISRNPATIDRTRDLLVQEAQRWLEDMTASREAFQKFRDEHKRDLGVDFPNVIDYRRLRDGFKLSATKAGGLGVALSMSRALADMLTPMAVDFLFAPAAGPTFVTADVPYVVIYKAHDPTVFDQVIIPLSSTIAAIFNASISPRYGYVDASEAVVRSTNRAMLIAAREIIVSKCPNIIPKDTLDAWAIATPEDRELIVRALAEIESRA